MVIILQNLTPIRSSIKPILRQNRQSKILGKSSCFAAKNVWLTNAARHVATCDQSTPRFQKKLDNSLKTSTFVS